MKLSENQKRLIQKMRDDKCHLRWDDVRHYWDFEKESNTVSGYVNPATAKAIVSKIELVELRYSNAFKKVGKTIQL